MPNGNIMLYDNGNYKTSPFDGLTPVDATENYSRAVEFSVDESNMTVSQVWQYGKGLSSPIYTPFIGDADSLTQTGNVLINFGGIVQDAATGLPAESPRGNKIHTRIIEVTHEEPATVVFDLQIGDTDWENNGIGYRVYRAERISSMNP